MQQHLTNPALPSSGLSPNLYNYTAFGADATSAFAEALPPTAPLYVSIDVPFKAWWEQILKRPPITVGFVLPVRHIHNLPVSGLLL